ncbi:MAG: hypothetical protein GXO26_04130 [Crenarchaeota archaeon]|nr:hypothetical protein [Thermoproteota archaeon]
MQDVRYLYDALNKLKIASILCAIICTILLLLPIFIITLTSGALISSIFSPYLQLINNHVLTYVLSLVSLIMKLGFITILIICIIIIILILILISVFGFIIPALNSLKNYDHTRYGTIFNIVFHIKHHIYNIKHLTHITLLLHYNSTLRNI